MLSVHCHVCAVSDIIYQFLSLSCTLLALLLSACNISAILHMGFYLAEYMHVHVCLLFVYDEIVFHCFFTSHCISILLPHCQVFMCLLM